VKETDQLKDLDTDGTTTLKYITERWGARNVDWTHLVVDREKWWALEKRAMKFLLP
jgi:hypothetical protein